MEGELGAVGAAVDDGHCSVSGQVLREEMCILG